MNQDQYPGLNGLSWGIGYLEQFLAILSEPLLIACAALAVVDFVTGGKLLTLPAIMYVWAGSLAIAVSACFIVNWRRAIYAFTANHYGTAFGLAVLGLALGLVDWSAVDVQSLQQTLGISFAAALAQLNLNIILITHLRSGVAIAMAVVVAMSNHAQVSSATAPKRRIVLVDKMLNAIAPVITEEATVPLQIAAPTDEALSLANRATVDEKEPTLKSDLANDQSIDEQSPIGFQSKEQVIADILQRHPNATLEEVVQMAQQCNPRTAEKWYRRLKGATSEQIRH